MKKAPFLTSGKDFKFNFEVTDSLSKLNIETKGGVPATEEKVEETPQDQQEIKRDFQFLPSTNTFRFNFSDTN